MILPNFFQTVVLNTDFFFFDLLKIKEHLIYINTGLHGSLCEFLHLIKVSEHILTGLFFALIRKKEHLAFTAQQGKLAPNTVMRILKLNLFPVPVRLHSGSGKLIFRRYFTTYFRYYSLGPVETPSYSASHQALNYAQRY